MCCTLLRRLQLRGESDSLRVYDSTAPAAAQIQILRPMPSPAAPALLLLQPLPPPPPLLLPLPLRLLLPPLLPPADSNAKTIPYSAALRTFAALMLRRAWCAPTSWLRLLSRRLASSVTVHPTPNENAFKFVLPHRIAVNGCSVDLRSRELFQPQHLDDVVAKVCRRAVQCPLSACCITPSVLQVASALFAIPAVDGLYFGPDFITVTRARSPAPSSAAPWQRLSDEIVQHLEKFCNERQQEQLVKETQRIDSSDQFDDPTEALIVDIIETQAMAPTLLCPSWFLLAVLFAPACCRALSRAAGSCSCAGRRRQHHVQALGRAQRHGVGAHGGRMRGLHNVQGHVAQRRAQAAAALCARCAGCVRAPRHRRPGPASCYHQPDAARMMISFRTVFCCCFFCCRSLA